MGQLLNASVTVTAAADGSARASIGPDSGKGPATWNVATVGVRNENVARRGQTPIPSANIYLDQDDSAGWMSGTYDGSFDTDSALNATLGRGQVLICVWAGAQVGDRLTLSVSGTKEA
ncbi:hypothetical protein [Streptomyces sp. NBC_00470]|uniref:hypothetical protein n=1 Tax=Streptomyces sp. NBC_00470 TaxID=2975753 RepID=UPI0030E0F9D7